MLLRVKNSLGLTGRFIGFDTEDTGLVGWGDLKRITYDFGKGDVETRLVVPARPFAFSFADESGKTAYVRGRVDPLTRAVTLTDRQKRQISEVTDNEAFVKVGHNIGHDRRMCEFQKIPFRGRVVETMILSHVMTAGNELTYALKPLSKKWLAMPDGDEKELHQSLNRARARARKMRWSIATKEIAGKSPAKADYWLAPEELCEEYARGDALRTILLKMLWYDECRKNTRSWNLFQREHKLFNVLKRMEDRGTRVFPGRVRSLRRFYVKYQNKQQRLAEANGGAGLNYRSTPQMTEKFYDDRGHVAKYTGTVNKKTGKHNYSLDGEQLLKLATGYTALIDELPDYAAARPKKYGWTRDPKDPETVHRIPDPLAKAVLEYKAAKQTVSSFLDVYERLWVKESRGVYILHPNFKQTGTVTGRLSCSDPNLMQVASETTGRRKADIQSRPREAFGPRPGYLWYLPDYSQIEVWLFAFLSKEEKMQVALLSGADYHGDIAKKVFGKRPDFQEHKDYYRKCAKLIMFAKLYGGGLAKLAGLLKMGRDQAAEFIDQYERELPGVGRYMKTMIEKARDDGEIFNVYGRRYEFEPHYAYRATNYEIQGTAADVMKNAMINVDHMLETETQRMAYLLLTIHDELCIEVPYELHSVRLMTKIVEAMQMDQKLLGLPVPLPVEMKVVWPGQRWNEAQKFDLFNRRMKQRSKMVTAA